MCYRIPLISLMLIALLATNVQAKKRFPATAEDYAVLYEMQLYNQFRGNSREFRERVKVAKSVIRDYKRSDQKANEQVVIQWFQAASQGAVPPIPELAPTKSRREKLVNKKPVAEYDWRSRRAAQSVKPKPENSVPATAEPTIPEFAPSKTPDSDPLEAFDNDEVDNAWDAESAFEPEASDASTGSFGADVAKDLQTQEDIGSGSQPVEADGPSDLDQIWGDATGDLEGDSAAIDAADPSDKPAGSEDQGPFATEDAALQAMREQGIDSNVFWVDQGQGKEYYFRPNGGLPSMTDFGMKAAEGGASLKTAFGKPNLSTSLAAPGAIAPMAMMGGNLIASLISLVCMFKQLIKAFKSNTVLGIVSLVFCGIGGLIIGWVKHKEWGLTKTMKVWTGCVIAMVILQFATIALVGMGSGA